MTAWYYGTDDAVVGPVDESALAELVRSGAISQDSKVRAEETADAGIAAEIFPELFLAPSAPAGGWTDTKPHPWRRYAARFLDNIIVGGVTWLLIGLAGGVIAPELFERLFAVFRAPGGQFLDGMLTLAAALPGNALMIGLSGLSIGKWIFGVRVLRAGRPIGFGAALSREVEVWWRGLACGVPLVSLATLWQQFTHLNDARKPTAWDARQGNTVTYRADSLLSRIWMWAAVIAMVGITTALRVLASR